MGKFIDAICCVELLAGWLQRRVCMYVTMYCTIIYNTSPRVRVLYI